MNKFIGRPPAVVNKKVAMVFYGARQRKAIVADEGSALILPLLPGRPGPGDRRLGFVLIKKICANHKAETKDGSARCRTVTESMRDRVSHQAGCLSPTLFEKQMIEEARCK